MEDIFLSIYRRLLVFGEFLCLMRLFKTAHGRAPVRYKLYLAPLGVRLWLVDLAFIAALRRDNN